MRNALTTLLTLLIALLTSSQSGNIEGVFEFPGNLEPTKDNCIEDIILVKEDSAEQFLWPPREYKTQWVTHRQGIINYLYQYLGNHWDFLVYVHPVTTGSGASRIYRDYTGGGIRKDNFYSPYIPENSWRLKTAVSIGIKSDYEYTESYPPAKELYEDDPYGSFSFGVVHEIGHHWCCHQYGFFGSDSDKVSMHHPRNAELFYGDTTLADIMQFNHWTMVNNQPTCVNGNRRHVDWKFSPFSLYLMGMLPPDSVPPITFYELDVPASPDVMEPSCYPPRGAEPPNFTWHRTITMDRIIELNGPREPTWMESQKDFKTLWISVVPKDSAVDTAFYAYVNKVKDFAPKAWSRATGGRSTLTSNCDETTKVAGTGASAGRRGKQLRVSQIGSSIRIDLNAFHASLVDVELFSLTGGRIARMSSLDNGTDFLMLPLDRLTKREGLMGTYTIRVRHGDNAYSSRVNIIPF